MPFNIIIKQNYVGTTREVVEEELPKSVNRKQWKSVRFVVDFGVLLQRLKIRSECRMGPVPLTYYNVAWTLKKTFPVLYMSIVKMRNAAM